MSFVDTNVLIYATAAGAPLQSRARAALLANEPIAISRQIFREYLSVMTRPQDWGRPLSLAEALADIATFAARFTLLEDGPLVWDRFIELSRRFRFGGRQVHDANIVATMLAHAERRLLTFNDADFRRFMPLIDVVVP